MYETKDEVYDKELVWTLIRITEKWYKEQFDKFAHSDTTVVHMNYRVIENACYRVK